MKELVRKERGKGISIKVPLLWKREKRHSLLRNPDVQALMRESWTAAKFNARMVYFNHDPEQTFDEYLNEIL